MSETDNQDPVAAAAAADGYEVIPTPEIPVFASNKFEVPEDVWGDWSERAQRMFNYVFWYMLQNQELFKHPKAPVLAHEQWKTTAWNAAWIAAGQVDADEETEEDAE